MDFEFISFLAILLVVFYIYKEIYAFYINKEKEKEKEKSSIRLVSITSALGLFFVIYNLLEFSNYNSEVYRYFLTTVITIIMWSSAYQFENRDRSSMFRAVKIEDNNIYSSIYSSIYSALGYKKFKRVSDFNSKQIHFYVRFTVYELIDENEKMLFDSSDYSVINKAFGAYENIQQSFSKGHKFEFKDKLYLMEFVKVDLIGIIDDYHKGHTNIYEGLNTPYNIQVTVKIKEIL